MEFISIVLPYPVAIARIPESASFSSGVSRSFICFTISPTLATLPPRPSIVQIEYSPIALLRKA
ncbi:hypothetical protein ANAPC5_00562 [Anaplasma phagocytophilum]|nr:hypothetical protein ANAPC2_00812 [Anaplasma phagocytophilum]SBO32020.1 hypothetical protein ANAPC3_00723 [Anaplasma phagocytophilum]SBO32025.1 hypothetical protein ANAPC4_00670 [Anaplasma phagocytophilum]SCV63430.1 hypothetical protein ANAPC5_00562 [Anaplasma phagocytophilum]